MALVEQMAGAKYHFGVALLLIVLALFGFVAAGIGSGSSGTSGPTKVFPAHKAQPRHQGVHCSARMKARPSAGGNQGCGGPPANP